VRFDVFRDTWGIPHLRAADPLSLAYAQGHVTATDRAWQLEVERHRLLGTSAALLGAEYAPWDRFARQARLADTARRCHAALDTATRAWVDAYVRGVNAALPEPYGAWDPWTPLGIWLSTHVLFAGFPAKLWREEVVARLGRDAVDLFATDGPGTSGSNGWLVPGDRTTTGAPLIAGDPHRFVEDPGVYQQIRLACPEFDVAGLAVPGVPGIGHFGHTGDVAWAITNAMADYQDLYRERLRRTPAGGVEAYGPDGWRPAHRHTEDGTEVIETDRGVVVIGGPDAPGGAAVSLRQPARVFADLGFAALPALLRARTVADVDRAFDAWAEPVNVVLAADTAGGLLHRVAGTVPDRDPENRLRVVPAWEERYAWRGRVTPLPRAEVDGVAVMANERSLAGPLGVEFAPPHRARRIAGLLAARDTWDADGMRAVHTDTLLPSAGPLLALVEEAEEVEEAEGLGGLSPEAAALRAELLSWDRHMAAGSIRAAAYARVRSAVVRRVAGHPLLAPLTGLMPEYPEVFRPWLALVPRVAYGLENLLSADALPYEDRRAAVRDALEEVAAEPSAPSGVTWGELHRLAPWQARPEPDADWPGLDGDHDCVLSTSAVPGVTEHAARGPAARYVWDLADRDGSGWAVPFGASGVPGDAHRRDQLPLWLRGELAPLVTDFARLDKETPSMTDPTAPADVHVQGVPGFGTFRIAPLDVEGPDIDVLHGWVAEERARFWGMTGLAREDVRGIYAHMAGLDTHHAYVVRLDGTPVALLQTYEPEADRVSECYPVRDGDIGAHLLVAPSGTGGARSGFTVALVGVLKAYLLDGLDRRRIVVEPDARNAKAIALFERCGFALAGEIVLPVVDLPEVYLAEKRAQLAFCER
jgi:penicillin amidase